MADESKDESKKDKFIITDARIKQIADEFSIPEGEKDKVAQLYESYKKFSIYFKTQYLAHFMRGIECYVREVMGDKRFIIVCKPFDKEKNPKKFKMEGHQRRHASSFYYHSATSVSSDSNKANSFIINYNDDEGLSEKERRDFIAHEIGHLLLKISRVMKCGNPKGEWFRYANDPAEAKKELEKEVKGKEVLSTIFGIFMMAEKNDFYLNLDINEMNHNDWQELFKFFLDNLSSVDF
jgi:hypothetical protein